jgi:hypothetical protein
MKYVIDRIEGDFAVCEDEDGKMTDIPVSALPSNFTEGTHFKYENGEYKLDEEEKTNREDMIKSLFDSLRK